MPKFRASIATIAIASSLLVTLTPGLCGQRIHRTNPTFNNPPPDPDGFINGDTPDLSNWIHPAAPDGNPFPKSTATQAELNYRDNKARLGKLLFWEEQMSSDNTMACGTCHSMAAGGTDIRPGPLVGGFGGAVGVIPQHQVSSTQSDYGFTNPASTSVDRLATGRIAPTMVGAYVFNIQFWKGTDGPTFDNLTTGLPLTGFDDWAGLEDQADNPPISDVEMAHQGIDWQSDFVQQKLNDASPMALVDPATIPPDVLPFVSSSVTYRRVFDIVFGNDPNFGGQIGVTRERIAMAIATYERTLIPDHAPIDANPAAGTVMTQSQINGFERMRSSGCFGCHSITGGSVGSTTPVLDANGRLTDPFDNPFADGDTHNINIGTGRIKTPTLRNVGLRQRFFSNGSVIGINNLIDFYDQPGRQPPLGFAGVLNATQRAEVIDFLTVALTDPRVAAEQFPFDRPELASERAEFVFEINEIGSGTPGPSNFTPEILANMPPLVLGPAITGPDADRFKVGVGSALPNSSAFLLISDTLGTGTVFLLGPNFTVTSAGSTNSEGFATVHDPIPLTTATIGMDFFLQWVVRDGSARSWSNAARFTPFQF